MYKIRLPQNFVLVKAHFTLQTKLRFDANVQQEKERQQEKQYWVGRMDFMLWV